MDGNACNLLAVTRANPALNCRIFANEKPMLNSQRIFVDAVKWYCSEHGIAVEVRSQGWLIVMRPKTVARPNLPAQQTHYTFGYDIGLNSAIAHRIANDKSATADVLAMSGVPCVPHMLFLDPKLNAPGSPQGSWQTMLKLLDEHPAGVVVKPNEGTSGKSVFLATNPPALELAVDRVFASSPSLAISPFVEIEDEVRVILIDETPAVVYRKDRPSVNGDG